ncbi:MAG: TfoX/Sxy family protein [Candidatus Peregrinibacteria bacterium]|nr:TfoX/Sxy family protein [Candidatus Peregrinibacteria bacterium]
MNVFDFKSLINIGDAIASDLNKAGVKDLKEMTKLGTEEIFFRHFQAQGGWKKGMCSCWLYVIEGAITNTKWNEIPSKRKKELCEYVKKVRESFSPK